MKRRRNIELQRLSASISKENKEFLEEEAGRRGVSSSTLLDCMITLFKNKTRI